MLSPIVGMALPAIAPIVAVAKMPKTWKDMFFKLPPWASSSLIAWKLGHMFTGVMAPYAMLSMDLILFPAFLLMKKLNEGKKLKWAMRNPFEASALEKAIFA